MAHALKAKLILTSLAAEVLIVGVITQMATSRYVFLAAAGVVLSGIAVALLLGGHGRGLMLAAMWLASGIAMGRLLYREPYVGEGASLGLFALAAILLWLAVPFDRIRVARLSVDRGVAVASVAYMAGTLLLSLRPAVLNLGMVVYEELLWLTRLGVVALMSYWVTTESDIRRFWNGLYLVVCVEAVATVLQIWEVNLLNLLVPQVEVVATYREGVRGSGMLGTYTCLGNYMAIVTPLTFAATLAEKGRRTPWSIVAFGLSVLTLVLAFTRAAWIAAGCGVAAVIVVLRLRRVSLDRRQKRLLSALSIIVFVTAVITWPHAAQRFAVRGDTWAPRAMANTLAVQMLRDTSFLGVGLHNFLAALVTSYYDYYRSGITFPVHNTFLLVLAETGVLGFALFCWMVLAISRSLAASIRDSGSPAAVCTSAGAFGSLVAFLVAGLGNMTVRYEPATDVLWLIVAGGLACARVGRASKEAAQQRGALGCLPLVGGRCLRSVTSRGGAPQD